MAEQYESFRSRGPDVSISLFGDAAVQGTNIGNSIPGTARAITEGVLEGIETGQNIAIKQNQIAQQPVENEIRAQQLEAMKQKNYMDSLTVQVAKNNEALAIRAQTQKLELEAATTAQKLKDQDALNAITIAATSNNPAAMDAALQNPAALGAMARDPEVSSRILANMEGKANKELLDRARNSIDAVQINKRVGEIAEARERATQAEALKNKEKIDAAYAGLSQIPGVGVAMSQPGFDPTKLRVVKASEIKLNPDGTPDLTLGDRPQVVASPDGVQADDKRVFVLNGKETIAVLPESYGKKAMDFYDSYTLAVAAKGLKEKKEADKPPTPSPGSTTAAGIGAEVEKQLSGTIGPAPKPTPTPPPSLLAGKTPEEQASISARFNQRVQAMGGIPRQDRVVVEKINSHPLLSTAAPLVKAVASAESRGDNSAVSPTGVKGIMQMTTATFQDMKRKYPELLGALENDSEQAEVVAGKLYLAEMVKMFQGDVALASAAYNAGPGAVGKAVQAVDEPRTWEKVKEKLPEFVSPEKYKEVTTYVDRVLKYYSYYA